MKPLIGIALAAYKPPIDFFEAQLQSIVDQSYDNWFCVITFDSQMDEVRQEPRLARFFSDSRFSFFQNLKGLGATGNFDVAAQTCLKKNPKYIAFSDQDDIWLPQKLDLLEQALATCPPLSLVHCDMFIFRKQLDGTYARGSETAWKAERRGISHVTPLDFIIRNIAAGAGMLIDAELVRRYPHPPADAFGHDHWYSLVASYFGGVHPVDQPLYDYRIHGGNITGISEYRGFFAARSASKLGVVNKCIHMFNSSRARLDGALRAGLPVSFVDKIIASSRWDFGLGYMLKAVMMFSDLPLARSCVVRAAGKIFGLFRPRYTAHSHQ